MIRTLISGLLAALTLVTPALAFEPFVVKDIRVEGIQRTEAGTVFTYLPVKVGDRFTQAQANESIRALFGTGFFDDVRIEAEDGVLVVIVDERPAVAQIDLVGVKEFDDKALKAGLREVGLTESQIFDRSVLERAEQELKRQYLTRGKYAATVQTTVTPLERNRVAVRFDVVEGEVAKIRQIKIVGNKVFDEDELVDLFELTTPGWITWYTKSDQYSRQKLSGDLETLRSFYLDQGYLDFSVDSTQVSITPDKKDIYITVSVTEGEKYTVSGVKLTGDLILPEEVYREIVTVKPGDVFSRKALTETNKAITDRLGNEGEVPDLVLRIPQLEAARARVLSAESSLRKARLDLERTAIRAPFAGRVLTKFVDLGQVVSRNTQLAEIYATDVVEIRLPIRNRDLPFIDLPEVYRNSDEPRNDGGRVEIRSELAGLATWEAELVRTEGAIDETARQLHVIARINDPFVLPSEGQTPLKIGQYVTAKLEGKTVPGALVVPNNSIYQGTYVYVVEDGILSRRDIDILWQNDEEAVVSSGLAAGDQLVTTALGQVTSGVRVTVSGKDGNQRPAGRRGESE